ncbi:MAG: diaminopimelate decarboxylase [Pyrinomonadaceae bacterium]|nr:diaminopimelate decarboxylase [Pyrinomonadaceae bacterium]
MSESWEIKNFLEIRNNHLCIDSADTVELARDYGSPLFVFSESRIRHNIARLQRAGDAIPCPLKICYAAKAMSTMGILQAVREAGIDIEVNSGGELWKALNAGFTGEQIVFNGTSKEIWEIENAINAGIYAIQVDSLYELSLIEETGKRLGKRANVSLRLVPEIESGTHSGLQTAMLTSKFGMMPDEAFSAFHAYKDSPHLDLCGIHLHVGSQNPDPVVYSEALTMLFESMVRIFKETGIRLKHINLGGGFPVNYLRDEDRYSQEHQPGQDRAGHQQMLSAHFEPFDAIRAAWEQVRLKSTVTGSEHLLTNLTVLLEPGRSIISDAGICLTSVRNKKSRPLTESNIELHEQLAKAQRSKQKAGISFGIVDYESGIVSHGLIDEHWLLTDAGFNILLSMETYKWYYDLISADRPSAEHNFPYKVAGPLCDGGDVYFDIEGMNRLPDHRLLPENLKPGEVLALLNCGAYSLAQASQYNGRFLPAVVLVCSSGEVKQIRKRDSFEDLIANDIY